MLAVCSRAVGSCDPGHSAHDVMTFDILYLKQQVMEELSKVFSPKLLLLLSLPAAH